MATIPKDAGKFPHHMVDANGTVGAANTNACSAVIASLNGGRGGSGIPDADRQGVWDHVAKHLTDDGKEPPALRSVEDIEAERDRSRTRSPLTLSEDDLDRLLSLEASGALTRADAISAIRKGLSA